jgi:hypothetical protein
MILAFVAIAFAMAPPQIPWSPADSGSRLFASPMQDSGSIHLVMQTGPRPIRVALSVSRDWNPDSYGTGDTTSRRPRAIEYDDGYYTRLTIHRVASYAELPLFGAEYFLGERLLNDERTGFPPSSLKAAHVGVAGGLAVLFAVNTVTGAWNLWDSRKDPANRNLRIVHSVAMLGADAGFAWAGAIGGNAKNNIHGAQQHRAVSVGSMALATAGTAIMWLFDK